MYRTGDISSSGGIVSNSCSEPSGGGFAVPPRRPAQSPRVPAHVPLHRAKMWALCLSCGFPISRRFVAGSAIILFSRPQYCFLIAANPMTLTLELPPDLEAGLVAHARAEGLSPELFVQHLLRDQVSVPLPDEMTPAQRAQAWLDSVIGLPWTPPLSDEAISRESMYGDRG